jgi:hypothetical protein
MHINVVSATGVTPFSDYLLLHEDDTSFANNFDWIIDWVILNKKMHTMSWSLWMNWAILLVNDSGNIKKNCENNCD